MSQEETNSPVNEDKQKALKALFAGIPDDFSSRYEQLKALHRAFHLEIAATLEPALNQYIRQQPAESLPTRQRLATWVENITRQVGLSIVSRTGKPALLVGEVSCPPDPDRGTRFALLTRRADGFVKHEGTANKLDDLYLNLAQAPTDVESLYNKLRQGTQVAKNRSR